MCCDNALYCYLDPNWNAQCCAIGSNCNSNCNATQVQCNVTSTVTLAPVAPATASLTTTSVSLACCQRKCTATSAYLCADEFGGGCCDYAATCVTSSCLFPATTSAPPPLVTAVPSGCTTGQFSCAASQGGGCCNSGSACTVTQNGLFCVPTAGANATFTDSSGGGLSSGAKAGIGAGVAVAVVVVAGLVLWFWISRRRAARKEAALQAAAAAAAAAGENGTEDSPHIYGIGNGRAMSEATYEGRFRPSPFRGQSEYSGPDAVAGPYTDEENMSPGGGNGAHRRGTGAGGSSFSQHSLRGATGVVGVGLGDVPENPGDIRVPVEIDSRVKDAGDGDGAAGSVSVAQVLPTPSPDALPESVEGRFELYGDDAVDDVVAEAPGSPPPPSAGGVASPTSMLGGGAVDVAHLYYGSPVVEPPAEVPAAEPAAHEAPASPVVMSSPQLPSSQPH